MKITPTTVSETIASIESAYGGSFSAVRWPYTYAFDYVRTHAAAFEVPDPAMNATSRTAVSSWLSENTDSLENKDAVCEVLARAYLRENRIKVTFCKFCDQPLVTTLTSSTWITPDGNASCGSKDSVPSGRLHQAA
jgi:hypothetical protein